MKTILDKAGSVGALVAAAACPIYFPKLALVGVALLGRSPALGVPPMAR